MTETATTSQTTTPRWRRWLNPTLAITGIAVGVIVIGVVIYLLLAQPGGCRMSTAGPLATQSKDCCAQMMADMKNQKMPMHIMPKPSPSPMPNMPAPTPGR